VKSEIHKESENRVAESVIPNKYRHHGELFQYLHEDTDKTHENEYNRRYGYTILLVKLQ
jgi:hypothetical protein